MLPTKKQFEYSAKQVGLKCIENLSFGGSYAKTLKMWNKQFQKSWNDLSKFGFDIKFKASNFVAHKRTKYDRRRPIILQWKKN